MNYLFILKSKDAPVAAKDAYKVFMKTQKDPLDTLLKYSSIQHAKNVSLSSRKKIFDEKTDGLKNQVSNFITF